MEPFSRIVDGLLSNPISATFTCIILAYLIFAVFMLRSAGEGSKARALVDLAPTILTTLGILGTFTGIFLGLLDFDIRTINKSVPALIEGLKVAFGTSILGLASALVFRVVRPIITSKTASDEVTGQDLINALQDVSEQVKEANQTNKEGFDTIRKALSDDSDSSVAGQLQRLRAAFTDLEKATVHGFEAQIKEFREFAEHMSKAFSEAIIEELKSVIREFNEKISEQFGDNFKQLNEAVGRLLEWQDNYKTQMQEMKKSFDSSVEALNASEGAIGKIEEATRAIPEHMTGLAEANTKLIDQLTKMHEGLSSIAAMRDKAENAIPEIASKIDEMTETISSSVVFQRDSMETIKSSITEATEQMQTAVGDIGKNIEASLGDQREAQKQMLDGLQQALNESLQNVTNSLNDAVVQLDEAMQKEIESVVRTMAESLSGVTQKFVSDYSPLLEQTRQIVELGKKARAK